MDLFGGEIEGVVVPDMVDESIDGWPAAVGSSSDAGSSAVPELLTLKPVIFSLSRTASQMAGQRFSANSRKRLPKAFSNLAVAKARS